MGVTGEGGEAAQVPGMVTLPELLRVLWRARLLIIISAVVVAAASAGVSYLVPKSYRATVLVAPVESTTGSALGSVAGRLGGLADLVGLGANSGGRKQEAIAVLQSDSLTARYITENELLPVLFAEQWDAATGTWKVSGAKVPTLWQATRQFAKHRRVAENAKTGLVQLIVEWRDPVVAARWANDLVALTNQHLRQEAVDLSQRNVAYLSEQADKASSVQVRNSMYQLIEDEMRSLMIAQGNEAYALRVIDPAVPAEKSSTPGLLVWLLAGAVGGVGFGMMLALILFGFKR